MRPRNPHNEARRTIAERLHFLTSRFAIPSDELLRRAEEEQARKSHTSKRQDHPPGPRQPLDQRGP